MGIAPRLALAGLLSCLLPGAAAPVAQVQGWAGPPPPARVSELAGGAKLVRLTCPELAGSARVAALLVFRVGSVHEPADKAGLTDLLARLLIEGGSVTQDGPALQAWLDERSARLVARAGLETIELELEAPAQHFDELLARVVALLVSPAYPEAGLLAVRARLEAELAERERDLGAAADDLVARLALGGETAWSRAPTPASLGAVRRMDVLGFHRAWLGQSLLSVGVAAGDDQADLAARCERALARLPRGAVPQAPDEPRFAQADTTPLWIIDAPDAQRVELRVATHVPVDEGSVRALELWVRALNLRGGDDAALRSAQRRVQALRFGPLEVRRALEPFGWTAAGNAPVDEAVDACEALYDALSGHPRRKVSPEALERVQRELEVVQGPLERLAEVTRDVAAGLAPQARREQREALAAVAFEDVERAVHTRLTQRPPVVVVVGPARDLYAPLALLGPVSVHNALQRPRGSEEALALRARMLEALGGAQRWARLVGTRWSGEVRSVGSLRPTEIACTRDLVRRWVRWDRDENGVPATIVCTPTGGWLGTMRSVYDLPEGRHARILRHDSRALEQMLHELACNPALEVRLGREGRLEVLEGDAVRCWIEVADTALPSGLGFDDDSDDPGRMAYSDWRQEQGYAWPGSVTSEPDGTHFRWTRFTPVFTIPQRDFDRPAR
jgi:predicted Zn-dependent peptidase